MSRSTRPTKKQFARRHIGERLETPLTQEKLVDYDELFKLVGGLACRCEVQSPHRGENVHHVYWQKSDYTTPLAVAFRELPANRAKIAKCNHHYLHTLTRPVPVPDIETMKAHVDPFVAQAGDLFMRKNITPKSSYHAKFWDGFLPYYLELPEQEQLHGEYSSDASRSMFNGNYNGSAKIESRIESLLSRNHSPSGEPVFMQLLRGHADLELLPEYAAA